MDGRMDGWLDGQTDRKRYHTISPIFRYWGIKIKDMHSYHPSPGSAFSSVHDLREGGVTDLNLKLSKFNAKVIFIATEFILT